MIVARSASDGTFRIAAADKYDLVAARLPGRSPSSATQVIKNVGRDGEPVPIELVLGGTGGALRGRVLTARGEAIANATVEIGNPIESRNGWLYTPPPARVLSAADGSFLAESLPPGAVHVLAGAPGYAVGSRVIEIATGSAGSIDIVLTAGATIRGRATRPSGDPVPALIYAHDLNSHPMLVSIVRANQQGSFVIEHVAPGSVPVTAQDATSFLSVASTLAVEEGASIEWNPVVPEGEVIRGELRDERDLPIVGWTVNAVGIDPPRGVVTARTDARGRFVLRGLAASPCSLTVSGDTRLPLVAWWIVERVRAGDDVLIRFPDRARPTAFLTGTLLTEEYDAPDSAATSLHLDRATFPIGTFHVDADTGEFRIGPLSPATYRLVAWIRGHKPKDFTITLDVDQTLDLGEVVLERPRK
jgi:hypothetical protein